MQPPYPHHPPYGAARSSAAGIRICPGCGIIAPLGRNTCSVCNAPFASAPVAAGRVGTMLFACIHGCDFTCTACGKRSPLATIDIDGSVECR